LLFQILQQTIRLRVIAEIAVALHSGEACEAVKIAIALGNRGQTGKGAFAIAESGLRHREKSARGLVAGILRGLSQLGQGNGIAAFIESCDAFVAGGGGRDG
jgi:hypothetical protein